MTSQRTTPLAPCRFCGESERLTLSEWAFSELSWGTNADGEVLRDEKGEPFPQCHQGNGSDHGVSCDVCEALVPLKVWNGSPDFLARMRANIIAADAEYDDAGVWQGQAKKNGDKLSSYSEKAAT